MDWARLLGVQVLARAKCAGHARSAQAGVRGRAGEGAGVGAGRWQERTGRAGCSRARAWSAGGHASGRRRGGARARAGSGTAGRAGSWAAGARAAGQQAWARGLGVAWAGLGQCTQCTQPIFDPF